MPNYQEPNEVTLHRGLHQVAPHEIDPKDLGVHWTQEYPVAKSFALSGRPPGYRDESSGTVLTGTVSKKNTPEYDTPEWHQMANEYGVLHPTNEERETPVMPNSRVGNLSAAQYINGKITRARYIGEGNAGTTGGNGLGY